MENSKNFTNTEGKSTNKTFRLETNFCIACATKSISKNYFKSSKTVYRQAWGVPIDTIRLSKKDIHVEKKTFEKDVHIQCALNSKVTIASFPDYSKAFDTIR